MKIWWNKYGSAKWIFLFLINIIFIFPVSGQKEFRVFETTKGNSPEWEHYRGAPNFLYQHISEYATSQLDERNRRIGNIKTQEEWKIYQKEIKQKLEKVLGPLPEKGPLNAIITKTIQKKGYSVEQIIYESLPGFKVTSSLFVPNNLNGKKAPVVIYCSGHTALSFRSSVYQTQILNLVMKGFLVFAFDPIGQGERLQYFDSITQSSMMGPSTIEHSYPGAQVFINGNSIAKYFIWDGIRAIDYLETRQEVDMSRIGITGRSGGGTQSAYIAALDDRVYASAPECWVTNFKYIFQSIGPQDAEQNLFHQLYNGIDHPDFLIARAPKPTLVINTTNDFFSIQGAMDTEVEVAKIYKAYDKPENFKRVEDFGVHESTKLNREAMYVFFQEHLDNQGNSEEVEVDMLTKDEWNVTSSGQLATSIGSKTVYDINRTEAEIFIGKLNQSRKQPETHLPQVIQAAKKLSGYKIPEKADDQVLTGKYKMDGYMIEKGFLKVSKDYAVPYMLFIPEAPVKNVLLYIHPNGKLSDSVSQKEILWFVEQGSAVVVPDLLGTGETYPANYVGDAYIDSVSLNIWFASVLVNKSIAGIRAEDITRLVNYIENRFEEKEIYALAKNEMGPVLLHAAAFNKSIEKIALIESYSSYASIVLNPLYNLNFIYNVVPGAIQEYDLPDLAACLAPRSLMMINTTDGEGKILDTKQLDKETSFPESIYKKMNVEGKLIISNAPTKNEDVYPLYYKWLTNED